MKRELAALVVVAALAVASIWNSRHITAITGEMQIALCKSQTASEQLNFKNSRVFAQEGLEIWQENRNYSRIFLSQTLVDDTTQAFYQLLEKLNEEDISTLIPAYDQLQYRLDSIHDSEKLSVSSIF